MKGKILIFAALVWGGVLLMLLTCQGSNGYAAASAPQATAPEQSAAPAEADWL